MSVFFCMKKSCIGSKPSESGDEDMEDRKEKLREKAANLPLRPGVYLMRDRTGKIIYVGKSKVLKNRVSQYFHESGSMSLKTARMVVACLRF